MKSEWQIGSMERRWEGVVRGRGFPNHSKLGNIFAKFLLSNNCRRLLLNDWLCNKLTYLSICYSSQRLLERADCAQSRPGHSPEYGHQENQVLRWRSRSRGGRPEDQQLEGHPQRWESNFFGKAVRDRLVRALEGKRWEHKRCVAY